MANEPNKVRVGVDEKGRNRAIARAGDVPLDVHHAPKPSIGMKDQTHAGNLARDGAVKQHLAVPPHSGMMTRTRNGGPFVLGGDLASKFDADPASPLQGPPMGKRLTQPQPVPGQRSRVNDAVGGSAPGENHAKGKPDSAALRSLGASVLAEAFSNAAPDDRAAHSYGIGLIAPTTQED